MFQLSYKDLVKPAKTVKVKIIGSSLKMHGEKQSRKAKVMVAVQMAYEYVCDFVNANPITGQLPLHTFSCIDEKVMLLNVEVLR